MYYSVLRWELISDAKSQFEWIKDERQRRPLSIILWATSREWFAWRERGKGLFHVFSNCNKPPKENDKTPSIKWLSNANPANEEFFSLNGKKQKKVEKIEKSKEMQKQLQRMATDTLIAYKTSEKLS